MEFVIPRGRFAPLGKANSRSIDDFESKAKDLSFYSKEGIQGILPGRIPIVVIGGSLRAIGSFYSEDRIQGKLEAWTFEALELSA